MTLSSRHRNRNSSPGGLRPSTLPLGHGGSPQYWLSHVDGEETFFVFFKPPRPGTEPETLAWKAAVLTTTLVGPPSWMYTIISGFGNVGISRSYVTMKHYSNMILHNDVSIRQHIIKIQNVGIYNYCPAIICWNSDIMWLFSCWKEQAVQMLEGSRLFSCWRGAGCLAAGGEQAVQLLEESWLFSCWRGSRLFSCWRWAGCSAAGGEQAVQLLEGEQAVQLLEVSRLFSCWRGSGLFSCWRGSGLFSGWRGAGCLAAGGGAGCSAAGGEAGCLAAGRGAGCSAAGRGAGCLAAEGGQAVQMLVESRLFSCWRGAGCSAAGGEQAV